MITRWCRPVVLPVSIALMAVVWLLPGAAPAHAQRPQLNLDYANNAPLLRQAIEKHTFTIDTLRLEFQLAEQAVADRRAELEQVNEDIRARAQIVRSLGFEVESVQPNLIQLEKQRLQLSIELAGRRARREVALAHLEELQRSIAEREQTDMVLEQLYVLRELENREIQRLRALADQAIIANTVIEKQARKVAEIEIRIEERRDELSQAHRVPEMAAANAELFSVALDVVEIEAKISAIDEQLERLRRAQSELNEFEDDANAARDRLLQQTNDAQLRMIELETQVNLEHLRRQMLTNRLNDLMADEEPEGDQ